MHCRRVFVSLLVVSALGFLSDHATASAPFLDYRTQTTGVETDRVAIRFLPETGARVRGDALVSRDGRDIRATVAVIERLLADHPGARLERRFPRSEEALDRDRRVGEARTRQSLPDLNLFATFRLPPLADEGAARARIGEILAALNGAPGIAEAWAFPKPTLAGFREIAVTPPSLPDSRLGSDRGLRSDTPDFSPQQGYLYAPPTGIWADSAWSFPGGKGEGTKMIDFEFGWLFTHEDLGPPWYYAGQQGDADHGSAVHGVVSGRHNGYGINGIAPEMLFGAIFTDDLAARIIEANGVLGEGDIYLIEIQVSGPQNWMPMEWIPDVFAAIQMSTALGIICCEAAGNGTVDLDDPIYGRLFDRRVRDSGAIVCGAGTPQGLNGEWFTNYGSRVSLQGWGSSVVTTCCGDLQGGDPNVRYTATFNGTSSASPIVTGAVASLQGQSLALFGRPLTPALVEEILSVTGTPHAGEKQIGQRPNLAAARERLLRGFGDLIVTVRDGDTHEVKPGALVEVVESGRMHIAGPEGQVAMQLTAGDLLLRVSGDFFYTVAEFPVTVIAGETREVVLDVFRAPAGSLAGRVLDQRGHPLTDARILVLETPLDTTWSGPGGAFAIPGIPENDGYEAVVGRIPAHGAAWSLFSIAAGEETSWEPVLVDAETFENGPAGYTATEEWQLGLPTFPMQNRPVPFSGQNCWGTDLSGPYDNLSTSILTSPFYNVSGATSLTLSFHHWYWIDPDDGGQVQVWDPGTSRWVLVEPIGGYPDDNIIIHYYQPGYNGLQRTWEPAVFPLDEFIGPEFRFRFVFKANYTGVKVGWYLDDIAIDTGASTVSVDPADFATGGVQIRFAGPNPTSGNSRIAFALGAPAETRLEIFDLAGSLLRTLAPGLLGAGSHEIVWDGRDEEGHALSSGVFFWRLHAGDQRADGRLVRIR